MDDQQQDQQDDKHDDQWQETTAGAAPRDKPTADEVEALGEEIALLAGQIAAATARFLVLLGEFDAVGGWGGVGIRSLPHWLSWRAGMSLRTAREHVRVACSLRQLPRTADAFGRGELSFSKVRAITRVATPDNERDLVTMAMNSPAAHVERFTAGLRKAREQSPDHEDESDKNFPPLPPKPPLPPPQSLQWRWDEDSGELVVWGRFGAADGQQLLAALTRAELERVRTTIHDRAVEDTGNDENPGTGTDAGTDKHAPDNASAGTTSDAVDRTAPPPLDAGPALVALAQIGLTVQDAPAFAPAAEVIYLHQRRAVGGPAASDPQDGSAEHSSVADGQDEAVVRADDGPSLDPGAGEEVRCDSHGRCVVEDTKGAVLAFGRKRRLFSSTQLKALRLRDRACRTPGCGRTRFLHAHHVVYWWDGGGTDLDNAVLLCSSCHRSVHLGRLVITAVGGQRFEFVDAASGRVLSCAPPQFGRADHILANRTITPRTVTGGWEGQPLDLSLATSEFLAQWRSAPPPLSPDPFGPDGAPTPPWDSLGRGEWAS
ncbi:HNH endonuclease [Ornithinimicrobium sp. LYQ103]|uniref:HNH endonuclease n=1 Tax=Ornithinimicrobium sp. LYQ103 TaxID=3378796 RepID=UPI003853BC05